MTESDKAPRQHACVSHALIVQCRLLALGGGRIGCPRFSNFKVRGHAF
jgi:hypothetical protein